MKILFLTTHLNTGGITSYLLTLSHGLIKNGHQVWVVSSGGNAENLFQELGVNLVKKNIKTKSELHPKIYLALPSLRNLILENKIDVIHAHTRVTQVMGVLLSKLTKAACVTTCHGFFKVKWARKKWPCWGDAVIAISSAVEEHLIKDFQTPAQKVALITSGIDIDRFNPFEPEIRQQRRRVLGITTEPVIGIIARLSDVKGIDVLLEAMPIVLKKIPEAKLFIFGHGKEELNLKKQVHELQLKDSVRFHYVVNNTANILPILDVFAMPSRQEGLGLSVMEAQACGLPVVASKVGGLPSLVHHEQTGLLVDPQNPPQLAQAIIRLLEDGELAKKLGESARKFIRQNYSDRDMVRKTIEFYEKNSRG